jgi:hypothetical protein
MHTRTSILFIGLLVSFGALPVWAGPVYYTINFDLTTGSLLPTSGSFYYDSSTSSFTNFDVVWDGVTFDLTSAANSFAFTSPTDPCYSGSTTGSQEVFLLMTTCSADSNPLYYHEAPAWDASSNIDPAYFIFQTDALSAGVNQISLVGNFSPLASGVLARGDFESSSAPEPGSLALMLAGLFATMGKRFSRGLHQAGRTRPCFASSR